MVVIKSRLTVHFIIVLKFSTEDIPFYDLYPGWTSHSTGPWHATAGRHKGLFIFLFFVNFPLCYGHGSLLLKGPSSNRLSSEGIATESLESTDVSLLDIEYSVHSSRRQAIL